MTKATLMKLNCETEDPNLNSSCDESSTVEPTQHMEAALWTAVAIIPILYSVNGPAVSTDQWLVRAVMVAIAYLGAPLVTFFRLQSEKEKRAMHNLDCEMSVDLDDNTKGDLGQ